MEVYFSLTLYPPVFFLLGGVALLVSAQHGHSGTQAPHLSLRPLDLASRQRKEYTYGSVMWAHLTTAGK